MKFKPLHDRVVVEPLEQEEKTSGGIIIPDTAKDKPMQGKVTAAGPGAPSPARRGGRVNPASLGPAIPTGARPFW